MGLNVLIDPEVNETLALSKAAYGVEVLIHDAEEFPQASVSSAIAQPGTDVIMSIVPSVISSKPAIRSLPVVERQCYFADEQKLRAARKYSLNSCLAECRVDYIVSKCDCVPFFYPELPAIQNKYRQCGLADVSCLRQYRSELLDFSGGAAAHVRDLIAIYGIQPSCPVSSPRMAPSVSIHRGKLEWTAPVCPPAPRQLTA